MSFCISKYLGDPAVVDDTDNFDNDENTDKYIAITWAFSWYRGNVTLQVFCSSETGFVL